ncbi:unnamed protein product [Prorocentrum cordatum]|uniref:Uncharacterized protein n=1 Tax=Prorocentrum cordatum TaxID=2364126 RepID=A0ABN9VRF3_9DINO|nr:unnamed protein product [Polarella glacialis]
MEGESTTRRKEDREEKGGTSFHCPRPKGLQQPAALQKLRPGTGHTLRTPPPPRSGGVDRAEVVHTAAPVPRGTSWGALGPQTSAASEGGSEKEKTCSEV